MEIEKELSRLIAQGVFPIDFRPDFVMDQSSNNIRTACKRAIDKRRTLTSLDILGLYELRDEVSRFFRRKHNVIINPLSEMMIQNGVNNSLSAILHTVLKPKDIIMIPNPCDPSYVEIANQAHAKVEFFNLFEGNNYLPKIEDLNRKAKIILMNYPNNPTGAFATREFFFEIAEFAAKNKILLVDDERFLDIYYESRPLSILNYSKEALSIFSFDHFVNMYNYNVSFVVGNDKVIKAIYENTKNFQTPVPVFIQDGALTGLEDEKYQEQLRNDLKFKKNAICDSLSLKGLGHPQPKGTIYVWQKVDDEEKFCQGLLKKEIAIACLPGTYFSREIDGKNPGKGFVRFSLSPPISEIKEAQKRILLLP